MPQPIIPIHQMNNLDSLFVRESESENYDHLLGSLSAMQQQLMGGAASEKTAARYSDNMVNHLEAISQEEEELLTVANSMISVGRTGQTYYRVPKTISDSELIGLKTQGLVVGSGRVVAFTDRAKVALRERWLIAENTLKKNRVKDGFDHPMKTAETSDKFTRTSERKRKIIVSEE
jgi:hypothetical protein